MTETQSCLLSLLSSSLFGAEKQPFDRIDYSELKNEALLHSVFPLIYPAIEESLPPEIKNEWATIYFKIVTDNIRIDREHAELHSIMERIKIPYTTIKGLGSAAYYPDPLLRTMGDVDFLVSPGDLDAAGRELEKNGFQKSSAHHKFHTAYHRNDSYWEMHFSVGGIPKNSCGETVRNYLSDLIEKSEVYTLNDISCRIPSRFHHGVIMLLHMISHIKGSGIGLRHLCDWAVYVDQVDIGQYSRQLSEMGLWTFACQLTAVSSKYLGSTAFDGCLEFDDDFLRSVIEDFVAAGNLGKKNPARASENNIVRESNPVLSLATGAKDFFPFADKYPILLPLAMVFFVCRFIWLRLTGKRKWMDAASIKEARDRKNLDSQFHVFETQ